MFAVLTLLSRRLSSRLRAGKDRSRWARHYEWPRATRCRCYKRADKMMFWRSFDQWTFLQSLARVAKQNCKWNNRRLPTRHFIVLDEVTEILALICTSILEDSVKEQFAVWNHYQEDTKEGHWLYTSRLEFTILCYVPSIFLRVRERKTLTTSSIGSVKELTSADTDVYRFSVATPMHMWVSLVFQAWLLQVFVQHPVQSGNTIQHVRIIRDMYSDILRNDIFWLYRTLFSGIHRLFMESQGTLALITYCVLVLFYHTFHRVESGEEQVTHCKSYKPIKDATNRPVVLTIQARLAYEGAPCARRHLWDQDKIFAAATQGVNRDAFINDVERELQRHISGNTSLLDVDVIYGWLHSSMRKAAEKHFTRSTQKRGRNQEYETAASHRAQCRRDLRSCTSVCILNPGKYEMLAQEQVRQIIVSEQSNVPKEENLERARLIELQEAWEPRDFATTWKLTRILTGKRIGPKKRPSRRPTSSVILQTRMDGTLGETWQSRRLLCYTC